MGIEIIDKDKIAEEGQKIYERIKDKLESYLDKIIAIDIDTEEYFLGDSVTDATIKAIKKHPHKVVYTMRIGYPATYAHR